MPASLETFSQSLNKLIKKFETDKAHYLSKDYSESQAKIDFITPFFKALGWDVENEAGLLHHEREVLVEKGETEGRPDYNFRLAGQTKFFVEAKAPSELERAAETGIEPVFLAHRRSRRRFRCPERTTFA